MCRKAREYTDLPVIQMTLQEMMWRSEFDGIWACASLLHVPRVGRPRFFGVFFVPFGLAVHFMHLSSTVAPNALLMSAGSLT